MSSNKIINNDPSQDTEILSIFEDCCDSETFIVDLTISRVNSTNKYNISILLESQNKEFLNVNKEKSKQAIQLVLQKKFESDNNFKFITPVEFGV